MAGTGGAVPPARTFAVVYSEHHIAHSEDTDGFADLNAGEGIYKAQSKLYLARIAPMEFDRERDKDHKANYLNPDLRIPIGRSKLTPLKFKPKSVITHAPKKTRSPSTIWTRGIFSVRSVTDPSDEEKSVENAIEEASNGSVTTSSKYVFGASNPAVLNLAGGRIASKPKRNYLKEKLNGGDPQMMSRWPIEDRVKTRIAPEANPGLMCLYNSSRALHIKDFTEGTILNEDPMKLNFSSNYIMCHTVNTTTFNPNELDILVGLATGEIRWIDAVSFRFSRFNKGCFINPSPPAVVAWLPGSENFFVAGHCDGSIVFYDRSRDDSAFIPDDYKAAYGNTSKDTETFKVIKSIDSSDQSTNPAAYWKLSGHKINALAFSPSGQYLAVGIDDGTLRVIEYCSEKQIHTFRSYFGGFTCIAWSPDSKYIFTGSQDDCISIFSLATGSLTARCEGHRNTPSHISIDTQNCDLDNEEYVFGSIGDDGRLLFWDFSAENLIDPPLPSGARKGSIVNLPLPLPSGARIPDTVLSMSHRPSAINTPLSPSLYDPTAPEAPVSSRTTTSTLRPVMNHKIESHADKDHAFTWFEFFEDTVMAMSEAGRVYTWKRPQEKRPLSEDTPKQVDLKDR